MNAEDELPEESESEDDDYFPAVENQVVSEEEEEGGPEQRQNISGKRKQAKGKKKRKRKKKNDDSDDDSDDEDDVDFIVDEKESSGEQIEDVEDVASIAERERIEKERTDLLWADFLTSVETSKTKKKENRTEDKVITKVYDFAGERIEVQEKVKSNSSSKDLFPPPNKNGATDASTSSGSNLASTSNGNGTSESPSAPKPPRLKISFLSGDPADIGLSGDKKVSGKEGLANVLNALHARNKKLGTLEKSKLDWENYKKEQNLQEELQNHTKSKNGYIDKQEFLQRADLRQFEIEKNARTKRRRNV